jgi:hypothetical protein
MGSTEIFLEVLRARFRMANPGPHVPEPARPCVLSLFKGVAGTNLVGP